MGGFALISALLSLQAMRLQKALKDSNEYLVAWFRFFFSLPLLVILWLFIPTPTLDAEFYRAFAIALPLEIVTIILYIKALRVSPLSLTLPFPCTHACVFNFHLISACWRESLVPGGAGIFLIAAGSYALNIDKIKAGIFEPFRSIPKEKRLCLYDRSGAYLLFYRITRQDSYRTFLSFVFVITYYIAITICLAPIAFLDGQK